MAGANTPERPLLLGSIGLAAAVVFIADLSAPLGVAVWIVYLIPLLLCVHTWRPWLPLAVAGAATALMVIGYWVSPSGVNTGLAVMNRGLGIATVWIVASIVSSGIRNKLRVWRQEWLLQGQRQLAEQIAGDKPADQIAGIAVKLIAEYVGAAAAVVFVPKEGLLSRAGVYALPRLNEVPQTLRPGEGMVGQVAVDRRILLSQLPSPHLRIGSALGEAQPAWVVVAPMVADQEAHAVLELAFAEKPVEAVVELLGRVSEPVAVAFRSAGFRARLQELLEETQRQAEELQAQSEELRVANEELSEQSRAVTEANTRLEEQQAELEQTNEQLEKQARILEAQRDELASSQQALRQQAQELQQSSQYKSEFLANMSHELRTPLNSTLILAKLLADNPAANLTPDQIKYAQTIESAGRDLLALINDVLDLAKVEAGRFEVQLQPVSVEALVANLRRTFQPQAEQKQLALTLTIEPGVPAAFKSGEQRLEQILRNLLSNAIKFTDAGEVRLVVARAGESCIAFAVTDTGVGIPEEQQEVIFEPFRQANGSTNRRHGGTGLGLSIAREFARLLNGHIDVRSRSGSGSTFTVVLPLAGTPAAPAAPREPRRASTPAPSPAVAAPVASSAAPRAVDDRERLSGNRRVVLIVEDDPHFAGILRELAHELQFQVLLATTGDEALVMAVQYRPSAVVLDIGLPDSNGLAVLDQLKHDSRTRHIPVHVVSGRDHAEAAYAMGAVGYALKPVVREDLVQAFRKLEQAVTRKLRRVLVVEDDPRQLQSLRELLGSQEVETVGAESAEQCLSLLRETTFDCMVLDLSLPDASGFSLLETLSTQDRYAFPPVIVYTGRVLSEAEEQQLRRYSKSIIIKGARSPERLLDEVTLFLHQVETELPADKQRLLRQARDRDATLEGRRLLIVEDDVRNVFALTSIFETRGAQLVIARNGREAIAALQQAGATQERVDLVLMDVMMPEMDGLTATREIRKRPEWRNLPIIVLTAKAMKADQEESLRAGANDYLAKPLDMEKLLSLVRIWLPR
jgi:signal transduction histidine kinase/DNA-binding response OmpR family regulator